MNRRQMVWIAAAVLLSAAGAGAAAWWLERRRRERGILRAASEEDFRPQFTEAHIEALRRLRFSWDPLMESGGPLVDPYRPYGGSRMSDDLASLIGTRDALAVLTFHTEVASLLAWALKNAPIAEGPYPLDEGVREGMAASLHRTIAHLPAERIAAVMDAFPFLRSTEPFILGRQHVILLRALRFEWPSESMLALMDHRGWLPVATVNFKRPFGDMTAFELDMESILALPPADDRKGRQDWMDGLYRDMWPALQVFVANARRPAAGVVGGRRPP